jgi:hypothetical protein
MHLLIPFAFCSSPGCASALPTLQLPHLDKLLSRLTAASLDTGDEFSLSPPHERALAAALSLAAPDGLIPWAALEASKTHPTDGAWGFITPCHWQAGTHQIAMSGQALPDFSAQESQTLLAAMLPYFEEDGIALFYDQPHRWLARGDLLKDIATASLDRVVGRNLENWMPRSTQAAGLRRLQNEMQMLLYTHPVNDARTARGATAVNSFWLSGTGAVPKPLPQAISGPQPTVTSSLRPAALNEDWAAWAQAWATLDATEGAALLARFEQGDSIQLTLCGERHSQTFHRQPQTNFSKLKSLFGTQRTAIVLEKL